MLDDILRKESELEKKLKGPKPENIAVDAAERAGKISKDEADRLRKRNANLKSRDPKKRSSAEQEVFRKGESKASVAKRTDGTWENAVERARKRLNIKPGSDEDKLLKSALYTQKRTRSGGLTQEDIDSTVKSMQSRRGREYLQDKVYAYRKAANKDLIEELPFTEEALKTATAQGLTAVEGKNGEVIELFDTRDPETGEIKPGALRQWEALGLGSIKVKPETQEEQDLRQRGPMPSFAGFADTATKKEQDQRLQEGFTRLAGDVAGLADAPLKAILPSGIERATRGAREGVLGFAADAAVDYVRVPYHVGRIADTNAAVGDRLSAGANLAFTALPFLGPMIFKGGQKVVQKVLSKPISALSDKAFIEALEKLPLKHQRAVEDAVIAIQKGLDDPEIGEDFAKVWQEELAKVSDGTVDNFQKVNEGQSVDLPQRAELPSSESPAPLSEQPNVQRPELTPIQKAQRARRDKALDSPRNGWVEKVDGQDVEMSAREYVEYLYKKGFRLTEKTSEDRDAYWAAKDELQEMVDKPNKGLQGPERDKRKLELRKMVDNPPTITETVAALGDETRNLRKFELDYLDELEKRGGNLSEQPNVQGADNVSTAVEDVATPPKPQEPGASPGGSTINLPGELKGKVDETIAGDLLAKVKARKAARQAAKDSGQINVSSVFDPDALQEVIDDVLEVVLEKAIPIETAIRQAIKARGMGDDAYDEVRKGVNRELGTDGGFEVRNQYTDDLRKKYELEPSKSDYVPDDEVLVKAQALKGQEGDIVARYLAKDNPLTKKRPPTPEEQVAVGVRLNEVHEEAAELARKIEAAEAAGEDISDMVLRYEDLTQTIDNYTQALKNMGGEAARALGIRARRFRWENGNLRAEFVAKVGRAPSRAESVELDKIIKQRDEALAEVEKLKSQGARRAAQTVIRRPRKIAQALQKAEDDLAKWRKRTGAGGGKTRGAVIAPEELVEGAVLVARVLILRGARTVDEIFSAIRDEGIDLDEETMADAVLRADAESRIPRPKSVKPTLHDLRKELHAIKSKDTDVVQELLDEADRLSKTKVGDLDPAEYTKFVEDASSLLNRLAPGKSYDWQRLIYGNNAIDDPRITQARGRARLAAEKAREVANEARRADMKKELGPLRSNAKAVGNALLSSRQIITGPDVSFGFRQGWAALFSNPKIFGRMTKTNLKSFFSGSGSEVIERNIAGHERLDDALNAGLDISIGTGELEEDLSRILSNFWGYKQSQRAYQNSANQVRLELYDYLTHPGMKQGDKEALADFINVMTGRSKVVASESGVVKLINGVLFAPRYLVSRLRYLTPYDLGKAALVDKNYEAAKIIAREQAKFYGGMTAFLGLLKMGEEKGGYTIEINPVASNFGQIKFKGGVTIDATGGFGGYAKPIYVALNSMLRTGLLAVSDKDGRKKIAKEHALAIDSKGAPMNDLGMSWFWFLRGRTNPVVQAYDALQRTGTSGETKSFDRPAEPWEIAARAYVPIHVQNLLEGYAQDQSNSEIATAFLLEFLGVGTRHETKDEFKDTLPEDILDRLNSG